MNTKLKCLLLDDELPGLTYLRMLCEQVSDVEVVRAFNDPLKFVAESKRIEFDFCILDIEMPGLSGLEVARLLENKPVIFTSAYKDYAAEAFDIDAVDYVRKPIEKTRLEKAIQKVMTQINDPGSEKQFVQLNTNKGKAVLKFNLVVQITNSPSDKRDKLAKLEDGTDLVLKNISFEQLLSQLPEKDFCRINKKDVVAIRSVRYYSYDKVKILLSGKEIDLALGEHFRKVFLSRMAVSG